MQNYNIDFKIIFLNILSVFVFFLIFPIGVFASPLMGNGTTDFPFRITNCAQLQGVTDNLSANYTFLNDIDCTGINFTTIGMHGSSVSSFSGKLDGYNHTISNLTIAYTGATGNNIGLFGVLDGAEIKNFKIINASISSLYTQNVGGIAGNSSNNSSISNISFSGNVSGFSSVGGIVGSADVTNINRCSVEPGSSVISTNTGDGFTSITGGLIGILSGVVSISNSYSSANVTGDARIGGLVGWALLNSSGNSLSISNSYSNSVISGVAGGFTEWLGGLIGIATSVGTYNLTNVFSASSPASSWNIGHNVFSYVSSGMNVNIVNTRFDSEKSGTITCGPADLGYNYSDCLDVNPVVPGTEDNYFKGNFTNHPFVDGVDLEAWDFSGDNSVWQVVDGGYPTLRDVSLDYLFNTGNGTVGSPYEITTCSQLSNINVNLSAYYKLKNNIDCSSAGSNIIIGRSTTPFTGNFDGQGYTITVAIDVDITSPTNYPQFLVDGIHHEIGLFSQINGGTVMDLRLAGSINTNLDNDNYRLHTGSIAGGLKGNGKIERVANTASVTCYGICYGTGGLVGIVDSVATINDSYNRADVTITGGSGQGYAGGLVGDFYVGTVNRSYNSGKISAAFSNGGLFGSISSGTITNSFNSGRVNGNASGGFAGIVYYNNGSHVGTITNNYFDRSRSNQENCWYDSSWPQLPISTITNDCDSVNILWGNKNYFKNTYAVKPFTDGETEIWDFSGDNSVWQKVVDGYPALRSIIGDDTAIYDEVPNVPTNLHMTNKTTTSISVAWDAPVGGADVVSYYVEHTTTGTSNWTDRTTLDSNNRSVTYYGFDASTSYDFRVASVNSYGESEWINPVITISTYSNPSVPTGLTITKGDTSSSINVSWNASTSLGGDGTGTLIEYRFYYRYGEESGFTSFSPDVTSVTNYSGFGLHYSTTYYFSIRAIVEDDGSYPESELSSEVSFTTPDQEIQEISTCRGLQDITDMAGLYKLTGPIDCSSFGNFTPLGWDSESYFDGTFDGAGYTIDGLTINEPESYTVGFFSGVSNVGIIKNLGLTSVSVTGSGYVGVLVGENYGSITNTYAEGEATGTVDYIGGLVGYNKGTINNSHASVNVSGYMEVGGLVGTNFSASINNSYSTGTVAGSIGIGGLVGNNRIEGIINNSYAMGKVTGATGNNSYVGTGGLAGQNAGGEIVNSYATGAVSGNKMVGGLVGKNSRPLGTPGTIDNSYSTGAVSGTANVGGLVGNNLNGASISNSFWDTETSGKLTSAGGTGKTTNDMNTQNTFTDGSWDFQGLWKIDTGEYPHFVWQDMQDSQTRGTATFQSGGTLTFPWMIEDVHELQFVNYFTDDSYKLKKDIPADETSSWTWGEGNQGFLPIGYNEDGGFNGTLDGDGFSIDNIFINLPNSSAVGIFSYTDENFIVENLEVTGANVTGGWNQTGILIGYNNGEINNVHISGTVGGGIFNVGGIVGDNAGTIEDSTFSGNVTGHYNVGGLVGLNEYNSNILKSYSQGVVNGVPYENEGIENSQNIGGLIGINDAGHIENTYSNSNVSGDNNIGGLIGYSGQGDTIINSYATGDVTGDERVGGLVGYLYMENVIGSYSTGNVIGLHKGSLYLGGLIGVVGVGSDSDSAANYLHGCGWLTTSSSNAIGATSYWGEGETLGDPIALLSLYNGYDESSTSWFYNKDSDIYKNSFINLDPTATAWNFINIWKQNASGYPTFLAEGEEVVPNPDPTCHDGIRNQDEIGIDSGGVCAPVIEVVPNPDPTCHDGIRNQDEIGIDSGGVCAPVIEVVRRGGGFPVAFVQTMSRLEQNKNNLTNVGRIISPIQKVVINLIQGIKNNKDVKTLQQFLIEQNKGPAAKALKKNGLTNNFGLLTKKALAEWQKVNGLVPDGIFGPKTRAKIKLLNL